MPAVFFDLMGIGSPIMDLLAHVDEAFLRSHVQGEKGGMVLVDNADIETMARQAGSKVAMQTGGSAANTILDAAQLKLRTTFLGKIGSDPTGERYFESFVAAGCDGSRFKRAPLPNGRCLSLITP